MEKKNTKKTSIQKKNKKKNLLKKKKGEKNKPIERQIH